MRETYIKLVLCLTLLLGTTLSLFATGEPSTYFNIFVPPNNDAVQRNVCLVITAISDSTTFTITDDGMDGDTDDTKSGILMAGESYILYIKDNGINDDARNASGGVLKADGDYFIITSNKNIYASQSTNSDWQHDWVPGVSQSSLSQKFIIYAPKTSSSKRDLNVFAYEDSTYVTLKKISTAATIQTGFTNVDYENGTIVFQKMIHRGQDLIHFYQNARNIMDDGHTYVVESSKPVTVQYGALFGNERDGGGYVPTNTGSCSGSLAYFAVPYQSAGEQEIRVISWDPANTVKLYRYNAGAWVLMNTWNMGVKTTQEWVGRNNGNASYPTVFKIECTAGKRVSIFEGNWFETGSPGTSDMATMMSSENGTSSGNFFMAYMAPPGNQANVLNPFTNTLFGGKYTHLYLFSQDTAHVTVKDAYTNGLDYTRTFTILPGRYADCAMSEAEWKSIYNGTGTTAGGPERPYLTVTSDNPIGVMNTNFNDNWMMYFGSSQTVAIKQATNTSSSRVIPGQTVLFSSIVEVPGNKTITDVTAMLSVEGGLRLTSANFVANGVNYNGTPSQNGQLLTVNFNNLPNLAPNGNYTVNATFVAAVMDGQGKPQANNSVSSITTIINGNVGNRPQQSMNIESVSLDLLNSSNLIFSLGQNTGLESYLTDSWTVSAIDYDGDNDDDLFFTDRTNTQSNKLFRNNGSGVFTMVTTGAITTDKATSMSSAWADYDNDGDLDVVVANNTLKSCFFYVNNGNGSFTKNTTAAFTQNVGYYHHVSWVDVDNDGILELYLGNYWPTRLNELWKRNAQGVWSIWTNNLLSQIPGTATGASWADINNDGYQDLVILDNDRGNNKMFRNLGDGNFVAVNNAVTQLGGYSVASNWGDVDNDGDLDLFISNASNMNNDLFFNNGNFNFTRSTGSIVNDRGHSHGAAFADVDKDGDLDLYVANDQGIKFLYMNNGSGVFTRKTDEFPTANYGKFYGSCFSDINNDGDLDLICATHSNQPNYIFTANNNTNKWIDIRLVGTNSNRSAIGARVKVKANGVWQTREVNCQSGLGGQSTLRQFFGLAQATTVDSIIVKWPSGYQQKIANVTTNQRMVLTEPLGAVVSATTYNDVNGNCVKDANEEMLENVPFVINNGAYRVFTDASGLISMRLSPGTYSIGIEGNEYSQTCPNPSTFTVQGTSSLNIGAFAIKPICTNANLAIQAVTPVIRRGFPTNYTMFVANNGIASADNVTLTASFPNTFIINSANIPWSRRKLTNEYQTYTWVLSNVASHSFQQINVSYITTLALMPGDSITTIFSVVGSGMDCDTTDNLYRDFQNIFGSFDPNDILAFPRGTTDQHFIHKNQRLTYRIRFQNVGNYAAEFVNILDTLPEGLDVASIKNIGSSHAYKMDIKDNVLHFYFPNINLPDSSSNQEASNGYIQFSIDQKPSGRGGNVLTNSAAIQFDYNEYIYTNTVFHTVLADELNAPEETLVIFPNPAVDVTYVKIKDADGTSVAKLSNLMVFKADGVLVKELTGNESALKLNVEALQNGIYLLKGNDSDGKIHTGKLNVVR